MIMHDRPCIPVEFSNNRVTTILPGTQVMNASLGSEVLRQAGYVDPVDSPLFELVQKIFHQNKAKYDVTPRTCAAIKCTKGSWTAQELSMLP